MSVIRLTASFVLGLVLAGTTYAQSNTTSILEHYGSLFSGPDEYYFFEDDRKQVVDYQRERIVRICAGDSPHLVPLKVTADERTLEVASGDSIRVEASRIYLEPARTLDDSAMIIANVETLTN